MLQALTSVESVQLLLRLRGRSFRVKHLHDVLEPNGGAAVILSSKSPQTRLSKLNIKLWTEKLEQDRLQKARHLPHFVSRLLKRRHRLQEGSVCVPGGGWVGGWVCVRACVYLHPQVCRSSRKHLRPVQSFSTVTEVALTSFSYY